MASVAIFPLRGSVRRSWVPASVGGLPELRLLVMRLLGEIEEARKGPWLAGDLEYRPELQPGDTDSVLKALGIARQAPAVPVQGAVAPASESKPVVAGRTLREAIGFNLATYENPPIPAGADPKDHRPTQRMVGQRRKELEILAEAFGPDTLTREIGDRDAGRLVEALRFLPQHWRRNASLDGGSIFDRSKRAIALKQHQMKIGAKMLLPDVPAALHGDDFGHYPGKWMRESLLPSVGLKDPETGKGRGLGMHASRHTIATLLAAGGASDDEIGHIVGHQKETQTHRYGQRLEATIETMAKLLIVPEIKTIQPRLLPQKQKGDKAPGRL